MTAIICGDIQTLAKQDVVTWRGWLLYWWDMGVRTYLSKKKPVLDETGWSIKDASEVNANLLEACGISVPGWDKMGEEGRGFYYGKNSDGRGSHNPVRVELKLPRALLESWNLC